MGHERQIICGLADLPISPTNSFHGEKGGEVIRRGPAAWWVTRVFDPVERAGYEAAKASMQFRWKLL
jgi:hypothetical protein